MSNSARLQAQDHSVPPCGSWSGATENLQMKENGWLRFINHYRTMCLAPQPDFRRLLEDVHEMRFAA